MDLAQQADAIALAAIKDLAGAGSLVALSSAAKAQRVEHCLDELTELLGSELDSAALLRFAAAAIYRANYNLSGLLAYQESLDVFLTELETADHGRKGRTEKIKAAIAKLQQQGHPLVSLAIERSQSIGTSLNASASGKRGKSVAAQIKAYAIRLYDAGTWKNPSQARHRLLAQVMEEAKRLKQPMSETEAPTTVYRWFLEHTKSMRPTS
jgi:hypothetical protein